MRLFVPTNWDDGLIEKLSPYGDRITLYGKAAEDFIGGGRPRFVLPDPDWEAIKSHITLAHDRGMKFSYLLNSACLGNMEMSREGQRGMREIIQKVMELGVDEITVSTRILLDMIKKIKPSQNVGVGFFASIDSVQKAVQWEEAGASKLALHPTVNRNFPLMEAIRRAVGCELQVFGTLTCIFNCHNLLTCGNTIAHSTNSGDSGDGHMLDHPLYNCQLMQLKNPELIISSRWIRPEDLHEYRKIGMDELKITERFNKTDTLVMKVKAYVEEKFDGNLLDLFASFLFNKDLSLEPENKLAMIRRLKRANFKAIYLPNYSNAPSIYLDGKKLDGFLEGFKKIDCTTRSCKECGYCLKFAEKAMTIDEKSRKKMIEEYEKFFEVFLSGEIFRDDQS
jgi:collagenase-like PrtC family protease